MQKFLLIGLLAAMSPIVDCPAQTRTPANPAPVVVDMDPAVTSALARADFQFTGDVRASFLASRKARAVEQLAAHGITLPPDFLAWIDADPVAAPTVYGIRHGSPAQALYVLRSLELDIGADKVRGKYLQICLAAAWMYAHTMDLAQPQSNSFSLAARSPLELRIPPCPLVKVDTHPKDRPLDVNDHIINFLEEEEVVTRAADGKETVMVKPRDPVLTAGKVVASLELQKEFNAYMARKGQTIKPLDCGDNEINTVKGVIWRHPRVAQFTYASKLFSAAYIAKGRLVKANDPQCQPSEWVAYQIRNAEDPARATNLQVPWPILMYVVGSRIPLREAEFVWAEKAKGINPMRYIMYIGSIAQAGQDLITLSRLQPYDFPYNSYPGKRLYGGVCGSHTHTACVAGATLGLSMINCSSPGHSYPGSLGKDKNGRYAFSGGHAGAPWYFGAGAPEGTGSDYQKLRSICWAVNHGLAEYADSQLAWTLEMLLPPATRAAHGPALLTSAMTRNPYNLGVVRAAQAAIATPQGQVEFHRILQTTLTAANKKPGCPDKEYRGEFDTTLHAKLDQLPVPADKATVAMLAAFLGDRGDALWAKYQIADSGLAAVQANLAAALEASVAGTRTTPSTDLLAQRILSTANATADANARKSWAQRLLAVLKGREHFAPDARKPAEFVVDPCVVAAATAYATAIGLPAAQSELEAKLTASVEGDRDVRRCEVLARQLTAVANLLPAPAGKNAPVPKAEWGRKLLDILRGHEVFAADPAKPGTQIADPCLAAIYAMDNRMQIERERLLKDYQAAVARNRLEPEADALALRTRTLRASIADKKELADFDTALIAALAGHEFFYPDPNKPSVMKIDPVMRQLQHKATKDVLAAAVKNVLANGQSPESSAAMGEYLRFLWTPMRWNIQAQAGLAREFIGYMRGHELYVPVAAKPSDLQFDGFLTSIYHNFGRTPHGQGGIAVSQDDKNACGDTLARVLKQNPTPATCAAMKAYIECLAGRMSGGERKAWGIALVSLFRGHEYLSLGTAAPPRQNAAAAYAHALAGQKFPPPPP